MRFAVVGVLVLSLAARAAEPTPPPMPPPSEPQPLLPRAPDDAPKSGFTASFAHRVSFLATDKERHYDVSINGGLDRCRTPCAVKLTADAVELTITRNGHSLTQDLVLPEGESQVFIRSYSPPLVITGAVLMGLSATALVAGAVLIAIAPYMFATWLLMLITPGVVLGIPGVVMTAVGANRPTTKLVTGAFTLGAVPK